MVGSCRTVLVGSGPMWIQKTVSLGPFSRGNWLITDRVYRVLPELERFRVGTLHLFLQHTSAGLFLTENTDPDVLADLAEVGEQLFPEQGGYRHRCEGPDDMPAHLKSVWMGCQLTVPVGEGRLLLGTWQGICLGEFRDRGTVRKLVLTLQGLATGEGDA